MTEFRDAQRELEAGMSRVRAERTALGLDGLVGGLAAVIVNTEVDRQRAAAAELLRRTGFDLAGTFEDDAGVTCVLTCPGSADILLRSRRDDASNPFAGFNDRPKSRQLPATRLETLVFETTDAARWFSVQRGRGVAFLTDDVVRGRNFAFVQTTPSTCTGTSIGVVEWAGGRGDWTTADAREVDRRLRKPDLPHLANIGRIDHVALRLECTHRVDAILELMTLTNYDFTQAFRVRTLNSITNVTRHGDDAAIVLTTGIDAWRDASTAGPTEKFVHNYGPRTHHVAFRTREIETTYDALVADGERFLIGLVGSPDEGLKQTFSEPSTETLIVNEYIHRYGGFDGFFTRGNVTALTGATDRQ